MCRRRGRKLIKACKFVSFLRKKLRCRFYECKLSYSHISTNETPNKNSDLLKLPNIELPYASSIQLKTVLLSSVRILISLLMNFFYHFNAITVLVSSKNDIITAPKTNLANKLELSNCGSKNRNFLTDRMSHTHNRIKYRVSKFHLPKERWLLIKNVLTTQTQLSHHIFH